VGTANKCSARYIYSSIGNEKGRVDLQESCELERDLNQQCTGARGSVVVKVLCYNPEGRGSEIR
jgi:hypothetical protein